MDIQNSQVRRVKVEQKAKLAREDLARVRKQSDGSTEAAEESLRQLTEMLNRAQDLDIEVRSSKSQMDGAPKTRDGATISFNRKGREAEIF